MLQPLGTGLLPHSYMVDSAMLCREGHPRILPLLPHLPGVSLESLRCIFRFDHVMDVFDDDHTVVLHALQLGLQSASDPLRWLWQASWARRGSSGLFERAPAAPPQPLQNQSQVPHVPPAALPFCYSKPVCHSSQDDSLQRANQFHQWRWHCCEYLILFYIIFSLCIMWCEISHERISFYTAGVFSCSSCRSRPLFARCCQDLPQSSKHCFFG